MCACVVVCGMIYFACHRHILSMSLLCYFVLFYYVLCCFMMFCFVYVCVEVLYCIMVCVVLSSYHQPCGIMML